MMTCYLSGCLDSIPDTGADNDPGEKKTETKVPLDWPEIIDPVTNVKHAAPEAAENHFQNVRFELLRRLEYNY